MTSGSHWPVDKLNALRLGRRLVTEVPASTPTRRAFVDISPVATAADAEALRQGWSRPDRDREFKLAHWEYEADRIDGFDYDIGAARIKTVTANGEAELAAALQAWGMSPDQFVHPWQTKDPR
jgi:hypothetical protein